MPGIEDNPEARPLVASGLLASKNNLGQLWHGVIDLLFPPRCSHCQRVDWRWCPRCMAQLRQTPIKAVAGHLAANTPLDAIFSSGEHSGILQSAVQALKYEAALEVAAALGDRLARMLGKINISVARIIPVPLHAARFSQRGYNQAQLIAQRVADRHGIACDPAAINRLKETRTQVGLDRWQRQINVGGAFQATHDLTGQHIVLVDDVFTTGATIAACAQAARDAGASKIIALTVTAARLAEHRL